MRTIEEHRAAVEARIAQWCGALPKGALYAPMDYLLHLPAKRVRPVATLMACELFGGDPDAALDAALGIELFHNFTLMHDDIMDASPIRRGQPTVHVRWGANMAILSGDAMLVKAYQCMGADARALAAFNSCALQVCEGQELDMAFEKASSVTAEQYMGMIRRKTAVLLAGALEIGGIKAGSSEQQQRMIGRFGEQLGLAFQLRDDHIDAFGDPGVTGKQRGGDLRAGKKTWLLIRGLELERAHGGGALTTALGQLSIARDVGAMVEALIALGVREESDALIRATEQEAMDALDSVAVADERKAPLRKLAMGLMGRKS
ncbi:MAG: polyprenyl synthetase family protein [Flavobacteriales bacterium]|nr:polyprenyl synthetase family protein [Flavobacteriales bacterium]